MPHLKQSAALLALVLSAAGCLGQAFWTNQSPAGVTDDVWSVAFANGTFAAVTNQGNLLISADGLTWSSKPLAAGTWLLSITYGNGLWVVVGDAGTILTSPDLQTWQRPSSTTSNRLNRVIYDGQFFIAVGENGAVVSSPDAATWTAQVVPAGVTGYLDGIAFGYPTAPLTTNSPPAVLVSGQNGVLLEGTASAQSLGIVTGPLTCFPRGTQGYEVAMEEVLAGPYTTVVAGGGGTVLFTNTFNGPFPSEDGPEATWSFFTQQTLSPSVGFHALTFGNGYFVLAGEQGTIFSSPDGQNWTQRFSGSSPSSVTAATLLGATFSSPLQRYIIVGTAGTILASSAPQTVFANVSTRGNITSSQSMIGGFVVEGNGPRTVLIRADGPALATFGVIAPLPDPVLTIYDNKGNVLTADTGWTTNQQPAQVSAAAAAVGAFPLSNPGKDSAVLLVLQPGAYTAVITSAGGNSGTALFEAYTY